MTREEFNRLGIQKGDMIEIIPRAKRGIRCCGYFVMHCPNSLDAIYLSTRDNLRWTHKHKLLRYPNPEWVTELRLVKEIIKTRRVYANNWVIEVIPNREMGV